MKHEEGNGGKLENAIYEANDPRADEERIAMVEADTKGFMIEAATALVESTDNVATAARIGNVEAFVDGMKRVAYASNVAAAHVENRNVLVEEMRRRRKLSGVIWNDD